MSVKDYLIRVMSRNLMVSETTIEQVVNHQFTSALQAMKTNDEVEISGFGKFLFNRNKAIRKLNDMEGMMAHLKRHVTSPEYSETKKRSSAIKLESTQNTYNALKTKVYGEPVSEHASDIRGMEERHSPSFPSEGTDSEGVS